MRRTMLLSVVVMLMQLKQQRYSLSAGYDDSASDYDITDTAAALISATDSVLNVDGVDTVSVTGGPVDCRYR